MIAIVATVKRRLLTLALILVLGAAAWWYQRPREASGAIAYRHTQAILAFGPRPPASPALAKVRGYLADELKKSGWVCSEQSFERYTPQGMVRFTNLRARLDSGADTWNRAVEGVLAAHVDSKFMEGKTFLGADDAASACAAILEIARKFTAADKSKAAKLELVFFDGEEGYGEGISTRDGLYGSRYYASNWQSQANKPKFGIVLDMIGHHNLAIRLPADTPQHLLKAVMDAAEQEKGAAHFAVSGGIITDDHVPLNEAGIPTVDIIGDFAQSHWPEDKRWWHTERDDLSIISAESLDLSIRVTLRTLDSQIR